MRNLKKIIAVVVTLIICILVAKKYGCALQNVSYEKFCAVALPCMAVYTFIAYMFIGCKEYQNYTSIGMLHNILVTVSLICILIWSAVRIKKLNTK